MPPFVVEAAIGVGVAITMLAVRASLYAVAGDRAPYALNFLAVVAATVLAGWRSGLIALGIGQLLVWYVIVTPYWSWSIAGTDRVGGMIISTLSQALILLAIRNCNKKKKNTNRQMLPLCIYPIKSS